MADCLWPDKARNAYSKDAAGRLPAKGNAAPANAEATTGSGIKREEGGLVYSPPSEIKNAAVVEERLSRAVGLLCKQFNIAPSEVNPDSVVLAEILHQLGAAPWLNKEMR